MLQTETIKRIEEVCKEFDHRAIEVSIPIARLELAKSLAETEAELTALRALWQEAPAGLKEYASHYGNAAWVKAVEAALDLPDA